tara:strand:+ start:151 stop:414 length:264 start_codon:yes stop_codon:yes gene_type:complete
MDSTFFQHPREVCMDYLEHCLFSLSLAKLLGIGTFKALVHAFFPGFFITSTSELIKEIKEELDNSGCLKVEEVEQSSEKNEIDKKSD